MTRSWIRRLFTRPVTHTIRKAAHRARLSVEPLEDRTVPSTFTVLNTNDSGAGSLREAIDLANASGDADTIVFNNNPSLGTNFHDSTPDTITLTGGELSLTDSATTTISGPGASLLSISGNNASRVFFIAPGAAAALSGLTITAGYAPEGGGVFNAGMLTLTACTIGGNGLDNEGNYSVNGGGMFNSGTVTLAGCTISGNVANAGGGVFNSGEAMLTGCTITGNAAATTHLSTAVAGGGVFNTGTAELIDCIVSVNTAHGGNGGGGGIVNSGTADLTLTNCTISGNQASGRFSNGGGVYNSGTAELTNCTVSGNVANGEFSIDGGGVFNSGTAELTNCTVSGNIATIAFVSGGNGGGVFNSGTAALTNCTVSRNGDEFLNNSGVGLHNSGTATLTNTIVAGQINGPDVIGTITGSNNLIGGDPLLAPLGDYGGPTQTMALLYGSPAIDAGSSADAPDADQRGRSRVGVADIGAFESQGFRLLGAGGINQSAVVSTAFAEPLIVHLEPLDPIGPVAGAVIAFTVNPSSGGASATLSSATATTAADGTVSVTATANAVPGSYTVTASAPGATSTRFRLTNLEAPSLVVTTAADVVDATDGQTSLREAIAYANLLPTADAITFSSLFDTPQIITLAGTELTLTDSATTTITGPGANLLSISGNHASRVFFIDTNAAAELSGLTITEGNGVGQFDSGRGGGLLIRGTVTLTGCTVRGNTATTSGGGLTNISTVGATLTDCTVSENTARSGGGLESRRTLTLNRCTVSGNTATGGGGGLFFGAGAAGTTVTLTDCTVSGNTAPTGGGLLQSGGATGMTLTRCTVSRNSATSSGGGLAFNGIPGLMMIDCTVSGNTAGGSGGGLSLTSGKATLDNCTFSGNTADADGGGLRISTGLTVTLTDCTISGNTAGGNGGGVAIGNGSGTVSLTGCTISGNTAGLGGGLHNGGTATLTNCIVANSEGGDVIGTITGSHNLIEDGSGGLADTITGDPLLGPLTDNGGPTQTMALLPGSPAINAGTSSGAPSTDQRGLGRVGAVDIGAYELQTPVNRAPTLNDLTNSSPDCGGAFMGRDAVAIAATFSDPDAGDTHTVSIDWGDGTTTPGTVNQLLHTIAGSHVYETGGVFTITVTLSDEAGETSVLTTTATVGGVGLQDGVLQIIGTDGRDDIHVSQHGSTIRVWSRFDVGGCDRDDWDNWGCSGGWGSGGWGSGDDDHDRPLRFTFDAAEVTSIRIVGCAGDDRISVGPQVDAPTNIDGGDGDNRIWVRSDNDRSDDDNNHNRGNVVIVGDGDNRIWTQGGSVRITAGDGDNEIHLGGDNDRVEAGDGDNRIWGGRGRDTITVGGGSNRIDAGDGDDAITIDGGGGHHGGYRAEAGNQIKGGGGNDLIRITGRSNDTIDAGTGDDLVYAGGGNDVLDGGNGNDVLVGGNGDDVLKGGEGRDLLIGGRGSDRLVGNASDDILIAGYTAYDEDEVSAAMRALMAIWTSGQSYAARVAAITENRAFAYRLIADGPNQTVFSDGAVDQLTGSSGADLFFANLFADAGDDAVKDVITDLAKSGETAADVDAL